MAEEATNTDTSRELQEIRDSFRNQHVPASYRPGLHIAFLVITWLGTAGMCLWFIEDLRLWELGAFVFGFVFSLLWEYSFHRHWFHHPRSGMAFELHNNVHHRFFPGEAMSIESLRDMHLVILPPWGMIGIVIISALGWGPLVWLGYGNLGWLLLLSITIYYAVYELSHTLSHVIEPGGSFDKSIFRAIAHHHTVHHQRQNMRSNLAFSIPLFDWVFGTLYSDKSNTSS